jgi:uncharacterized repeat protein (TIGR01451 family)
MNGYQYRAVFTNTEDSATTNAAILTVDQDISAPTITAHPQDTAVAVGEQASFTVEYTGSPEPAFQWQLRTNNVRKWSNITGANSDTYTTSAATSEMNGYRYRVILSNYLGSVTSEAVTLTVNAAPGAPKVTTQPEDQAVTEGETSSFSAEATGNPTPTVQWQLSTNSGSTWDNIEGAASTTYTTEATTLDMNGYQYRAVFNNTEGSATTNAATLTVTAAPVVVADVSITKAGIYDPETNTVTWTITVTNSGPDTAEGVVMTDNLSNNSRDISVTTAYNYKINGKKVFVGIGTLENGSSMEIIIIEELAKQATGGVTNTVKVTTTTYDPDLTNNTDTKLITIS